MSSIIRRKGTKSFSKRQKHHFTGVTLLKSDLQLPLNTDPSCSSGKCHFHHWASLNPQRFMKFTSCLVLHADIMPAVGSVIVITRKQMKSFVSLRSFCWLRESIVAENAAFCSAQSCTAFWDRLFCVSALKPFL